MRTYFHCCEGEADPQRLLDPAQHYTEPWGSSDHGRCEKCGGSGEVDYRCRSCLERGPDPGCPSCVGRVESRGPCPPCEGSGEIERTRRRGVAVFPSAEGLYRYMVERDADLAGRLIVEVAGRLSEDLDLDADAGALLVFPERVVEARPVDMEIVESIRRRLATSTPGDR
jgi:hypothetical protein